MSLNDSMTEVERSKLAVWDYPVSDRYTKIWQSMQDAGLPKTFEEALARVRASESDSDGFAFLGPSIRIPLQFFRKFFRFILHLFLSLKVVSIYANELICILMWQAMQRTFVTRS